MELTQELVKLLFDYHKDGYLTWKICKTWKSPIGSKVGTLSSVTGRFKTKINGKSYLLSRLIFLWHHGWLPEMVDHEDRNKINNKIENLRPATRQQNLRNSKRGGTVSRYKGVIFNRGKYWVSHIRIGQKTSHIGTFKTEHEAALAYNREAVRYHKEFAYLNIIQLS